MPNPLQLLDKSPVIKSYNVIDYKQGKNFYYIKVDASLVDDTRLSIRLYVSDTEYKYSFHWQDKNADLIIRWDNSPHHTNIMTFPHHKHMKGKVYPSKEVTLEDVLSIIQLHLKK